MSCSHLNLLLQLVVKGFNHLQSLKEAPLWSNPTLMHRYYNHNSNSCESMAELSADAIVLHGAKFLHTTQVCTQTAAGNETYQESADLADLQSKSGPLCLFSTYHTPASDLKMERVLKKRTNVYLSVCKLATASWMLWDVTVSTQGFSRQTGAQLFIGGDIDWQNAWSKINDPGSNGWSTAAVWNVYSSHTQHSQA